MKTFFGALASLCGANTRQHLCFLASLYTINMFILGILEMVGIKLLFKIFLSCMSGVLVSVSLAQDW